MKKIKLILASMLVMCAVTVFAQDSTNISNDAAKDREGPGVGAQPQQQDDYKKDMTVIEKQEVPANLRSTLKGDQYKGWEENATIYKTRSNDSFIVEMKEGDQTKVHRFDQNGKRVKDY
jgi:uncharacterized protein YdeI (BOF family)